MKKQVHLIYLLLVFVISYALIFVGAPYFFHDPAMFRGFGGLVPAVVFVMVWIPIFAYFLIRKLTFKATKPESKQSHKFSVGISVIVAIVVFWLLIFFVFSS